MSSIKCKADINGHFFLRAMCDEVRLSQLTAAPYDILDARHVVNGFNSAQIQVALCDGSREVLQLGNEFRARAALKELKDAMAPRAPQFGLTALIQGSTLKTIPA